MMAPQIQRLLLILLLSLIGTTLTSGQESENTTTIDPNAVQYVKFNVQMDDSTTDSFVVEVHPEWAPIGAARFLELVDDGSCNNLVRFFRVLPDFIVQFGISGVPEVADFWMDQTLMDEPVLESNTAGTLSFAMASANTRTTQVFVNLVDNLFLDDAGFAPFAKLYSERDMQVVNQFYAGYGEGAPEGNGPDQYRMQTEGTFYLQQEFPELSYIISAERLDGPPSDDAAVETDTDESDETPPPLETDTDMEDEEDTATDAASDSASSNSDTTSDAAPTTATTDSSSTHSLSRIKNYIILSGVMFAPGLVM